jgi:Protein of unknown function (DUF3151)
MVAPVRPAHGGVHRQREMVTAARGEGERRQPRLTAACGLPQAGGADVSPDPPLRPLPLSATAPPDPPPRHETILPEEEPAAREALDRAVSEGGGAELREVLRRWPALLDGWARLGQRALADGDAVAAYAFARTGYHRGLDRLRAHGWAGVGRVRWAQPTNRGFLRSLHLLLLAAARIGEVEEAERCRRFLLELDPDDGLGVAAHPAPMGADVEIPLP